MLDRPIPDAAPYRLKERSSPGGAQSGSFDIVDRFGVVAIAAIVKRDWAAGLIEAWNASHGAQVG